MRPHPASLADRLAARIAAAQRDAGRPLIVGLCGPQGAGKSTLAAQVAQYLGALGLSAFVLSIDDVYLIRAERRELAAHVHPLLAVRGPPGTHDLDLAHEVLDALVESRPVAAPRFDKATDDRCDPRTLQAVRGPTDAVIFEGWCVGARPQSAADLARPINALERDEDPDAVWRTHVNAALAGPYQALFDRLDLFVLLQAPGFEVVTRWRQEQEHALRDRVPSAPAAMTDAQVARFVQLYKRLTRHIAGEAPNRADIVISLGDDRTPIGIEGLLASPRALCRSTV